VPFEGVERLRQSRGAVELQPGLLYTTLFLLPRNHPHYVNYETSGFSYCVSQSPPLMPWYATLSETNLRSSNQTWNPFAVKEICWRIPLVQPWQWQRHDEAGRMNDYRVTREDIAGFVRAARFEFSLGPTIPFDWPVALNEVYYNPPLVQTPVDEPVSGPRCDCVGSYEQKLDLRDHILYIQPHDHFRLRLIWDREPPEVGGVIGVYFVLRGDESRHIV